MSDFERNRGFGRFLLTESAAQTLGQLVLAAGDALFVQDGNHRRIFPIHPWQGTFLALELLEDHLDAAVVGQRHFDLAQELLRIMTKAEELRRIVAVIGGLALLFRWLGRR